MDLDDDDDDDDDDFNLSGINSSQIKALAPYGSLLSSLSPNQVRALISENDGLSPDGRTILISRGPRKNTYIPPRRSLVLLMDGKKIFV